MEEEVQESPSSTVEPLTPQQQAELDEMENYIVHAEENGGLYTKEFIREEICTSEMEYATIPEFGACYAWYQSEAVVAFGNLVIGLILGVIVVKGLFDSWR